MVKCPKCKDKGIIPCEECGGSMEIHWSWSSGDTMETLKTIDEGVKKCKDCDDGTEICYLCNGRKYKSLIRAKRKKKAKRLKYRKRFAEYK